jgi:hypothetical protein
MTLYRRSQNNSRRQVRAKKGTQALGSFFASGNNGDEER